MTSPADLVAHLNANLPGAWTVAELPYGMRRRYGARLILGDCRIYVAASRVRVDVFATEPAGLGYTRMNAPRSALLRFVRDAAGEIEKHHPATAPEWAKVTT